MSAAQLSLELLDVTTRKHPCPFPGSVLEIMARHLPVAGLILDPFAGIGRIHQLATDTRHTIGVELEPEWARAHPRTLNGDAAALAFPDDTFDGEGTSPAYGNRLAQNVKADGTRRFSYSLSLGRRLTPGSGAALRWGDSYRELHAKAIAEMVRTAKPGAPVLVNMKDHQRNHRWQHVPEWWTETMVAAGLELIDTVPVATPGLRFRQNASSEPEYVIVTRKAKAA